MSGEKRWMPTTFMPTMLLPERWAEDTLPPSERGPWASITCGDIETRDEVLAALRAAARVRETAADAVWLAKLARGSSWPGEMADRVHRAADRVVCEYGTDADRAAIAALAALHPEDGGS